MSVESFPTTHTDLDYYEERCDLAAAFRWSARLGMNEGIANHFSAAVSDDGQKFLMNPFGTHWAVLKASDLLLCDAQAAPEDHDPRCDPTAIDIHGAIHRNSPRARCIMHVHSKYATVLASLEDPTLPAIDQNTARFHNRVAVDSGFDGMGLDDEAERISQQLGNGKVLMMGNHGFLTVGPSIAEAFDEMYYFERSCENYVLALMTQKPLSYLSDDVAEKTAQQWEDYQHENNKHLASIREVLDKEDPSYKF